MPATARCRSTSKAVSSMAAPDSLARMTSRIAGGRGRLPVCVVSTRPMLRFIWSGLMVGGANPLRHAHQPGIDDELAHLGLVDGGQIDVQPVVAHVRFAGQHEFGGLSGDRDIAPFLGEPETHD